MTPTAVREEPLIYNSPNSGGGETEGELTEERGDLLVRGLMETGQECILYVRIVNADAPSHRNKVVEKILQGDENEKKRKYLGACWDQRCSFILFICTADGVMAEEESSLLTHVARKLAQKCHRPYSIMVGYVRARMSIAVVHATQRCLWGSRVPERMSRSPCPQWEDGSGFRYDQ